MNVKDVVLSEMSQTQKDRLCTTPLIGDNIQIVGFITSKAGIVVNRGWGGGNGE